MTGDVVTAVVGYQEIGGRGSGLLSGRVPDALHAARIGDGWTLSGLLIRDLVVARPCSPDTHGCITCLGVIARGAHRPERRIASRLTLSGDQSAPALLHQRSLVVVPARRPLSLSLSDYFTDPHNMSALTATRGPNRFPAAFIDNELPSAIALRYQPPSQLVGYSPGAGMTPPSLEPHPVPDPGACRCCVKTDPLTALGSEGGFEFSAAVDTSRWCLAG